MTTLMKASNGGLFIQYKPGGEPHYIGCVDVDAITAPKGDLTPINCHADGEGEFVTLGQTYGAPGNVTTTITALVNMEASELDAWVNQTVNAFFMQYNKAAGKRGIFTNYTRGVQVLDARITSDDDENVVMRETDDPTTRKLAISGTPPKYTVRPVTVTRQTTTEAGALNDIWFDPRAENKYALECQNGFTVADTAGGLSANMQHTHNAGVTWTAGATDPFAAALSILSGCQFEVDYGVKRQLVVRGTLAATPYACNYSDDAGATWQAAEIAIGATVTEAANSSAAIFALDRNHIFTVTDGGAGGGRLYKSTNGGEAGSWTEINIAALVGANNLFAIKFCDHDTGLITGAAGIILRSVDGGDNWAACADPTGGSDITACHIFDKDRLIVGSDDGELWQTWDGGVNWTECAFRGNGVAAEVVKDITFSNPVDGYMVHASGGVGYVHRTKDGGYTWERLTTPAVGVLNALYICDQNNAFACGEVVGGTGVILHIAG